MPHHPPHLVFEAATWMRDAFLLQPLWRSRLYSTKWHQCSHTHYNSSTLHHHSHAHCTVTPKHTAPSAHKLQHHSQAHCIMTHKPGQLSAIAKLCCNAGNFAPGVDLDTGRYSVLGSLPQISSVHGAMHDYHTQSEVGITPKMFAAS